MSEPQSAEAVRAGDRACGPGIVHLSKPLTEKELDRLKAKWERKRHGHPKILGLPRRVRLRLAAESAINHAGTWLVYRGHYGAAERLWRAFRMWK